MIRTEELIAPGRVAVSRSGEVYFADGNRIRSLASGVVAGNGEYGLPDPEVQATESPLGNITDLAVNSKGELYFLVGANRLIMRITPEGELATVLDGGYFASSEAPYVQVTAIDFDLNDNLMLVDTYGRAIRKLDEGGVLTLLAGGVRSAIDGELAREALLNQPVDIEVDRDGSVIVVDQLDHKIRRISLEGIINTVAGTGECGWTGDGGPALEARLCWPSRVTIDTQGNIIFVDGSTRIRRIGTDGVISTIAGGDERSYSGDGGPATEARFGGITDVVADSNGNIYVGDWDGRRVRRITPDGNIETVAGTGELSTARREAGPGTTVPVTPSVTAVDFDDSLLIYDLYAPAYELLRLRPDGMMVPVYWSSDGVLADDGFIRCQFRTVTAMVADADGVIASDGVQLCRWDRTGKASFLAGFRGGFSGDGGSARNATFLGIQGLAVDSSGNIYVADTGNLRIRKLTRQ